jgi:hypothetical protein
MWGASAFCRYCASLRVELSIHQTQGPLQNADADVAIWSGLSPGVGLVGVHVVGVGIFVGVGFGASVVAADAE